MTVNFRINIYLNKKNVTVGQSYFITFNFIITNVKQPGLRVINKHNQTHNQV